MGGVNIWQCTDMDDEIVWVCRPKRYKTMLLYKKSINGSLV